MEEADIHNRLRRLLDEMDAATQRAQHALTRMFELTEGTRQLIGEGVPVSESYSRLPIVAVRDELFEAEADMKRSLGALRAEIFRVMVDHEGVSLSAVARFTDRSRQFVTRLYESAVAAAIDEAGGTAEGASPSAPPAAPTFMWEGGGPWEDSGRP
jgi:hypothetical protein